MKLFQDLRDGSRLGTYSAAASVDQVQRIVSYRSVEGHPLVVTVSIGEKEVLEHVRVIAHGKIVHEEVRPPTVVAAFREDPDWKGSDHLERIATGKGP